MKERAGQKIRLTSVEELLGVSNKETAMDIEIGKIRPFKDHPFKVVDDDKMQDLVDSIRENGILSPVLLRPVGNDRYEMVCLRKNTSKVGNIRKYILAALYNAPVTMDGYYRAEVNYGQNSL